MASWEEPTGETPAANESTGRNDVVRRRRSPVDQAIATLLVGVLVATVAVLAFLFGRARTDSSVTTNSPVSTVAIAVDASSTTSTTRVSNYPTTTPMNAVAGADVSSSTTPTTASVATTAPPTTPTTAPTTTAPATTAPPTTTVDTTPP